MFWKLRKSIRVGGQVLRGYWKHEGIYRRPKDDNHRKPNPTDLNPFRDYFESHSKGRGIWKWNHYFDVYNKHLGKFIGKDAKLLEIGIYSGGSLDMWKSCFGTGCEVFGVDIEEACLEYENQDVQVFVGDQQDRDFWSDIKTRAPQLDIIIDDGGHEPEQQITSIEEMLPHLRPGGVYICEDVHGGFNDFASYVGGLVHQLNSDQQTTHNESQSERRIVTYASEFQSAIHSIHFYPFLVVIEKNSEPVVELVAPKRGTSWQPHLS